MRAGLSVEKMAGCAWAGDEELGTWTGVALSCCNTLLTPQIHGNYTTNTQCNLGLYYGKMDKNPDDNCLQLSVALEVRTLRLRCHDVHMTMHPCHVDFCTMQFQALLYDSDVCSSLKHRLFMQLILQGSRCRPWLRGQVSMQAGSSLP